MAVGRVTVRFTANFEANLAQIAAFCAERDAPQAYLQLLDDLGGTVLRNLEQHPRIGRKFFARTAGSVEVRERVAALLERLGAIEVREYLSGDYLLLYAIVPEGGTRRPRLALHLLAIRHGRQLSFEFDGFWGAGRADDDA